MIVTMIMITTMCIIDMYTYIYIYIYTHTCTHVYTYIYIYRERERQKEREREREILWIVISCISCLYGFIYVDWVSDYLYCMVLVYCVYTFLL